MYRMSLLAGVIGDSPSIELPLVGPRRAWDGKGHGRCHRWKTCMFSKPQRPRGSMTYDGGPERNNR